MAKDVKTAAYVILRNHLENAKFNELEEIIVNAMMEYAILRLSKASGGNTVDSKECIK